MESPCNRSRIYFGLIHDLFTYSVRGKGIGKLGNLLNNTKENKVELFPETYNNLMGYRSVEDSGN